MATVARQESITVGETRVTYLPDGEFYIPPAVCFPETSPADWQPYAHLLLPAPDGRIVGSVGAHLIQVGELAILIDAGNGPRIIDREHIFLSGGELLQSLARAGLTPDDIDIVFYTHLHIDHVGWSGNTSKGTLTFPRARHLVRSSEWQRFDERPSTGPFSIADTLQLLAPHIGFIEDGQALAPGVSVVATPGHTIGHASLLIEAPDQRLFILGDAFHGLVELDHPEWISPLDDDAAQTEQTRRALLHELAVPGTIGSCIHFPNSAFGRLITGENDTIHWQTL